MRVTPESAPSRVAGGSLPCLTSWWNFPTWPGTVRGFVFCVAAELWLLPLPRRLAHLQIQAVLGACITLEQHIPCWEAC